MEYVVSSLVLTHCRKVKQMPTVPTGRLVRLVIRDGHHGTVEERIGFLFDKLARLLVRTSFIGHSGRITLARDRLFLTTATRVIVENRSMKVRLGTLWWRPLLSHDIIIEFLR